MSEDSPSVKAAEPEAKVCILTYNLTIDMCDILQIRTYLQFSYCFSL